MASDLPAQGALRPSPRAGLVLLLAGLLACQPGKSGVLPGGADAGKTQQDKGAGSPDARPTCTAGKDLDGDGYGKGCPAGDDCNDGDAEMHPGAVERCDGVDNDCDNRVDEGVLNSCGTCDPGCAGQGQGSPLEVDPTKDINVKEASGVVVDGNGDLTLGQVKTNFNYMWIANTYDTVGSKGGCIYATESTYDAKLDAVCRGSISKVDTVSLKEVARYFTTTCHSQLGVAGCVDLHGRAIDRDFPHAPSRTAVDYNFDVWVANRDFGGQPSATKIANALGDCVDRNKNGVKDTSQDRDGDGKITVDCDGDGQPDSASTTCAGAYAAIKPEFLGDDDECVLFTINYGDAASSASSYGDVGRSVCLDTGRSGVGASSAWVGTYSNPTANRFYKIDGTTGVIGGPYTLPKGHHSYGCAVDSRGVLWSADINGNLAYLDTSAPTKVGALIQGPEVVDSTGASSRRFYGISMDGNDHIWLGGYLTDHVFRYKPDRASWGALAAGTWTWIKQPSALSYSRGIAADNRGRVWVAINNGYLFRLDQSLGDGAQDLSSATSYWATPASTVIGVGVDFAGHVWGISYSGDLAARLDVDSKGDPVGAPTLKTKVVGVGKNPYTYSDFTGYGLRNFTRPSGRYVYQFAPCPGGKRATWEQVIWRATTPNKTSIQVRARAGDNGTALGNWTPAASASPLLLNKGAATPLSPNPSVLLQVEFTLQTQDKQVAPVLHDFSVTYSCGAIG